MSNFTDLLSYMYPSMKEPRFTLKLWDVGHGLSIWIQTPAGHNHWIDLGKTEHFSPSQHVKHMYNVDSMDYLIISHPDKDHLEDLPSFLESFGDPRVILRNRSLPEDEKYGDLNLDYQKEFKKLDMRFTQDVEWNRNPANPKYNGGLEYLTRQNAYSDELKGNNTSVVTMVLYKELLIVCPGDIEPTGWESLWNRNGSDFERLINRAHTRVLVAPHHGRKSGYSRNMMEVVEPHLVIISDIWGASETQDEYRTKPIGISQHGQKIPYFSTKLHGRVEISETYSGDFEYHQYE